jgi:hypothetical protein
VATIATTTNANPFQYPGNNLVVKQVGLNRYMALVKASTADNYTFYRSQDGGGTWAALATVVRANVVDVGSIFADKYGWTFWAYRTNESSQDRIYLRVINSTSGASGVVGSEFLMASPGNGGVAGSVYSGLDVISHYVNGYQYAVVAVGTRIGAQQGVTLHATYADNSAVYVAGDGLITGTRRWMFTGGGGTSRIGPQLDKEHTGDGYSAASPNLWVTFGRDSLYLVKVPWVGSYWTGPSGSTPIYANTGGDDTTVGRWDGARFLMCAPDPTVTDQVLLLERDKSNSKTITRHSPSHPNGVVRQATLSYNATSKNVRIFAVGTTNATLYFVDYVRATDTWGAWTSVAITVMGTNADNFGAKVSTFEDAKFGVYTATSGAPNTLTYTPQSVSFSPNTPTWSSPPNGAAVDVGLPLRLDWVFSDSDPGDTQSAYAVSRQIGAGALSYWRASDSTWQVAEVQNTSTSDLAFIPAGWGSGGDAVHTYKVKVWDSNSNASGYSSGLAIVPSVPVNPSVTAPTANQVIGTSALTVTWTAAEQIGYRITLDRGGILDTFTRTVSNGWGTSDSGQAWTTTGGVAGDYSTSGSVGTHSNGSLNVLRTTSFDVGAVNQDVTVDCIINKATPTTAPVTQRVCARYADANNHYIAQLVLTTGGAVTLQLLKKVGGTLSGDLAPSVTLQASGHASGDSWRVRIQVVDTAVRAKAWPAGVSEPPGWYHDVVDTDLVAGTLFGVISRVDTGNTDALPITTQYDNVYAVPGTWPDYDSSWIDDSASRTVIPPVALSNGEAWVLTLRTRNLEGLESTSQRVYVTTNFTPPATPSLVVTPVPSSGINRVALTNPAPVGGQPAFAYQDLYRRVTTTAPLNPNPYFETNTADWTGVNATISRSTTQAHEGLASCRVVPDGTHADDYAECGQVAADQSQWYQAAAWIRADTVNKPIRVYLLWYTGAGAFISSTTFSITPIALVWYYLAAFVAASTVPTAGKVSAAAGVGSTPAVGDAAYVDEVKLSVYSADAGGRIAKNLASGATYDDWAVVSGVPYEYRAVVVSTNGTSSTGAWTT